jgi:hypothetical protein
MATQPQLVPAPSKTPTVGAPHHVARGFAQIFGIHPAIAFLTLIVDTMLFGGEAAGAVGGILTAGLSLGAALMFSTGVAVLVGFVAYRAQKSWYGDDSESAAIKAVILTILVAIPTPIPAFVYMPAGVVGLLRRKKN